MSSQSWETPGDSHPVSDEARRTCVTRKAEEACRETIGSAYYSFNVGPDPSAKFDQTLQSM